MKPLPFDYIKPSSLDDALRALDRYPEAAVLAGGQSLVAMLNMRLAAPSHLIDINGLPLLSEIAVDDGWLRLGALVRHRDIERSAKVAQAAPLLSQAVAHIAHPAIRNRGTIGGSLALADPAAELPACVLALGGRLEITGRDRRRSVAAADFFHGLFQTDLAHGELLTAIEVPVQPPGYRSGFMELARRHGDYALVGLAAHGRIDGAVASDLRLVYFGVGDRPVPAWAAAHALEGKALTAQVIQAAMARLDEDLSPADHAGCRGATKLHLARVIGERVLSRIAA